MEATLSELGIQNRHALIVVPHRQPGQVSRPQSSPSYDVGGNSGPGGYFGYLRTVLSYVNPLSYLRGNTNSSNPELQSNEGLQQLSMFSCLILFLFSDGNCIGIFVFL